jgi:hypothetical protein
MNNQPNSDAERDTIARDTVQMLNRNELIRLMSVHELLIPAKSFPNWRPTQLTLGDIPGVMDGVTIIATDGLLGYFLHTNGVLIGHIHKFTSDVKPLFSVQKPKDSTDKAHKVKRINKLSARQKLLNSL